MIKLKYNKKKICIISSSRAELGQLSGLIKLFQKSKFFKTELILTGLHLNKFSKYSHKEALLYDLKVSKKINIKMKKFKKTDISMYFSYFSQKFANYFAKNKPEILLILGDRYETLAIVSAAYLQNIPIVHLHGGEITSGSKDDSIRHAITKLSNFHFVANETFKKRLIKMGEQPKNIFTSGMPGLTNVKKIDYYSKKNLIDKLNINFNEKNILVTLHPEFDKNNTLKVSNHLFSVLKSLKNTNKFICSPNADAYSDIIRIKIKKFLKEDKNSYYFENLGTKNYLSLAKFCNFTIGNSSSGITEMPYIGVPSINLGMRQMGRPLAKSVISVGMNKKIIKISISKILNKKFHLSKKQKLYYFERNSNEYIYKIIKNINFKNVSFKIFKDS